MINGNWKHYINLSNYKLPYSRCFNCYFFSISQQNADKNIDTEICDSILCSLFFSLHLSQSLAVCVSMKKKTAKCLCADRKMTLWKKRNRANEIELRAEWNVFRSEKRSIISNLRIEMNVCAWPTHIKSSDSFRFNIVFFSFLPFPFSSLRCFSLRFVYSFGVIARPI